MIKYASLFSGIGGFERGIQAASEQTGIETECVFASEFDPESKAKDINKQPARIIYNKNFGEYPHGDITKINASDVPDHDILVGHLAGLMKGQSKPQLIPLQQVDTAGGTTVP